MTYRLYILHSSTESFAIIDKENGADVNMTENGTVIITAKSGETYTYINYFVKEIVCDMTEEELKTQMMRFIPIKALAKEPFNIYYSKK